MAAEILNFSYNTLLSNVLHLLQYKKIHISFIIIIFYKRFMRFNICKWNNEKKELTWCHS